MDQNLNKEIDLKSKFISFSKKHKYKMFSFLTTMFILLAGVIFFNETKKKKNILLSEKYIKAGILLNNGQKKEAKKYYENILDSKNKFYSLLALNILIEKNLVQDKKKIIFYFSELEKKNFSPDYLDIIQFKKALYLIKTKDFVSGKKILEKLINTESNLKEAAKEIIN